MQPERTPPSVARPALSLVPASVGAARGASPHDIIEAAAEAAREMLGMTVAFVSETRAGVQAFGTVTGDGASFGIAEGDAVPLEGTYCRRLLAGELPNIVVDARAHPVVRDLPATTRSGVGAYIGVPITLSGGEVFGTFCCLSHEAEPQLRDRDVRFLTVLGRLIADQLERDALEAERQRLAVNAGAVRALLKALEARDGYTEAHSHAVVELALAAAGAAGITHGALLDVEHAALLHDIGKIGISDAILRKPRELDEIEWAEVRRHPEIGEWIVGSMPELAHLGPIIRAEHERWDGAGYPDGLRGKDIPPIARLVFVCDAYHAMTSDRPYRKALTSDAALRELSDKAGTQFCPRSVAAVVAHIGRQSSSKP